VGFDMFSKIHVKGRMKAELYKFLTSPAKNPQFGGELKWNFTKFLLNREGEVIARFEPRTRPEDSEFIAAVRTALEEGA
jgi:glutathione peroxidase